MEESDTDNNVRGLNYSPLRSVSPSPPVSSFASLLPARPRRMVHRDNGRSQIRHLGVPRRGRLGKLKDGFTTLLDARWIWVLLFFCLAYMMSWIVFAVVWLVVEEGNKAFFNLTCVAESDGFRAMLLFSIETQVTIGYGGKYVQSDCVVGILLLMVQCLIGLFLDSFLLGLVFAKLTRPRQRRKTILFSDIAVIHQANGERVMQLRIIDLRRSQLVEAHVRLSLYWYRKKSDGEYGLDCYDLDVGYDTGQDRVFFMTPVVVTHRIDESSPLYEISNDKLLDQDLEIVVVLEAIVESTGLTVQALWSYTEREILTNHRFLPMVCRQPVSREWAIDLKKINHTEPLFDTSE